MTSTVKWRLAGNVRRPRHEVIVGGSPWRALRLTEKAARQLDEVLSGEAHPRLTGMLHERGILISERQPANSVEDVTVVIPTTGTLQRLGSLIAAIPARCPVIVVNDGDEYFGAPDGRTEVLRTPRPFSGPAAARNEGLARVRTEFVAFIDDDVQIDDTWIAALRGAFNDESVVLVGGRVLSSSGRGIAGYVEQHASALDMGERSGPVGPHRAVRYLPSAALMARTASMGSGFDPGLKLGEDVDLVWRTGGAIEYHAEVIAWHAPRASILRVMQRRFEYGTSAATLERKHPGELGHLVISGWTTLPWLGVFLFGARGAAAAYGAAFVAGTQELSGFGPRIAAETVLRGHAQAAQTSSRAALRGYWPVTLSASLLSGRFRRRVLPAIALGYVAGGGSPATIIDDVAYGAGLWWGCLRERNVGPLLPQSRRR